MPAQPSPHRSPAALMKPRGPSRSMSHPSRGCTQVWKRMDSVNANWMSESCQPVFACSGETKNVQAYCRLAIMIIAITDAPSWNQRLLSMSASDRSRALPSFIQQFHARIHRARRRHRHPEPLAQLDDRAHNRFDFHGPARLEILQHRRLVRPGLLAAGHSLIDRDRQRDAELRRDRFRLRHDFADQPRGLGMAHHFLERGPGQGAHRVETHVAEELHPDLVAEPDRNGTAESRGDQRLGNLARPIGPRAVGLAETDPIALVVTDDARLDDIRGKVRERSHNPPRLDGGRDDTARVHSLQPQPVELAAVTLEVPPRNAVLRAHDRRVWSEERRDLRRKAGESVRLDAEKD